MAAGICKRCNGPTGNPDGRQWYCESCRVERNRESAREERARNNPRRQPRKPCRGCGGETPGGPYRYCDTCRAERDERLREAKRQRAATWYAENRDRALMWQRERMRDPEQQRRRAERVRAWIAANPERAKDGRRTILLRYRARKAAAFVEDVHPLVVLERDDGICGICGGDVDPTDFHVDHVMPLAAGGLHCYANVQVAHGRCNAGKGARY